MTTTAIITRNDAIKQIADHLADRDRFIITVPPNLLAPISDAVSQLPNWTAYLDHGTKHVLCTDVADALPLIGALIPTVAVITIPKTTSSADLSAALRRPIADDGSQDLLVLEDGGGQICWPMLFIKALEIVDPKAALDLHAANLANAS